MNKYKRALTALARVAFIHADEAEQGDKIESGEIDYVADGKHEKMTRKAIDDIIVGLNNIAAKYGYGKGTEPFTNDEWNTIFRAKETIKHLAAENQWLKEKAAEQKSIAEHEHATQMEWFRIACDYKAENAELRATLSKIETVEKELRARLQEIKEENEE